MNYPTDIDTLETDLDWNEELDDTRWRGFVLKKFDSAIDAQAARYALIILENGRVYYRVFERQNSLNHSVLELLGIARSDEGFKGPVIQSLRVAVGRQRDRLGRGSERELASLNGTVATLGNALQLDDVERRIVEFAVVATGATGFGSLFAAAALPADAVASALGRAIGLPGKSIRRALRPDGPLCSSGFFGGTRPFDRDSNPIELIPEVCEALMSRDFDVDVLIRHLVRRSPPPKLVLDDYPYVCEVDLMRQYLTRAMEQRATGVNILLYGAPGTGKTEFVRALAAALEVQLYEVPNEDDEGNVISGHRRFASYALCQRILGARRHQMILFDEIEDVFGHEMEWLRPKWNKYGDYDMHLMSKSWTNERLETNPVPTVWVCNAVDAMDRAYLRRFDMAVELKAPGPSATRRMVNRYFQAGEISDKCVEQLALIEHLPPAQIERAARVVRVLGSANVEHRDAEVLRLVDASLRAMGRPRALSAAVLPPHYDPAFVNADRDLGALVEGLRHGAGARLCFYGPPGTGKTAFGHHLAKALGAPIRVKRASDLLSAYLGATEELIAEAFRSAADERAILLIDEADSFLRDREGAKASWEVTQVNELLTQMEMFEGIFIASTNLFDSLDAAVLRRFDFKVRFDYLTPAQRHAMLARVCGIEPQALDAESVRTLGHMGLLTPGDFANVLRQVRVTGETITPAVILERLAAEVAVKPKGRRPPSGSSTDTHTAAVTGHTNLCCLEAT